MVIVEKASSEKGQTIHTVTAFNVMARGNEVQA
jgi:hypothetical protein